MRRSDREITDLNEIISIINDCKVIHLACSTMVNHTFCR